MALTAHNYVSWKLSNKNVTIEMGDSKKLNNLQEFWSIEEVGSKI